MREVLRMDAVSKDFVRRDSRVPVLEDVSISVSEGEIVAVVAGAGQGKTTLIELASGSLTPDRGLVQVDGIDVTGRKDREVSKLVAGHIGVAMRSGPPLNASAREYIELALGAPKDGRRRRWGRREQRSIAGAVLHELDITDCASLRWDELSDWQRVLVELGQAICVGPPLLLIDDIARDLGLRHKQALMDVLERLADERGCGVLMAVSDHASALRSVRVWQIHRHRLRLMADHSESEVGGADVLRLERRSDA